MSLSRQSKISVESWVEMEDDVSVSHEIDRLNDNATLYFGRNEYVMVLSRENLRQVIDLGTQALADLETAKQPATK